MRKRAEPPKETAAPTPAPETAVVTNVYLKGAWMNPRLVSGLVAGRSVRVRVKDRALCAPGMELPVQAVSDGLYEATAIPAKRGR